MIQQTTQDISVSVETFYQEDQSNALKGEYLFAYRITITNLGAMPVKLMRRHWYISDSNSTQREVEGEGVVGQQPVIQPGEEYQYISACNLNSEIGKMWGTYQLQNLYNRENFQVAIPEFNMIVPAKLN